MQLLNIFILMWLPKLSSTGEFHVGYVFNNSKHNAANTKEMLKAAYDSLQQPNLFADDKVEQTLSSRMQFSLSANELTPYSILEKLCTQFKSKEPTGLAAVLVIMDKYMLSTLTMIAERIGAPIIGLDDTDWIFSFKDAYPMYIRMMPSNAGHAKPFIRLLRRYGLFTFAILTTFDPTMDGFIHGIEQETIYNVSSQDTWKVNILQIDTQDPNNLTLVTNEVIKQGEKVFLLHCNKKEAEIILKKAERRGLLRKGYAWLVSEYLRNQIGNDLAVLRPGMLSVKYIEADNALQQRFNVILQILQSSLSQLSERNRTILKQPINSGCQTNVKRRKVSKILLKNILNSQYEQQRVFNEQGFPEDQSYDIINLQTDYSSTGNKNIWVKIGDYNKKSFNVDGIIWPGKTVLTPVEGVEMNNVKISAKVTEPFVELLNTSRLREWDCYSATRCLKPESHDKAELTRLFEEANKYTASKFDSMFETKEEFYIERDRHYNVTGVTIPLNLTRDMLKCCTGLMVDLINRLKVDMGFNYHLYIVHHNKPGSKKNGTWNGMVRDIINGAADLAIGAFSITQERSEAIDFTSPFYHSGFSIMAMRSKPVPDTDAFLSPLSYGVWILVVVCVHVVALCMTAFEWLSPYGLTPLGRNRSTVFSWPSALVHTWSMLFSHTFPSKAPKCWSARWVVNVWGCFSFVFIASYTANLAAFMAGFLQHHKVENIYDKTFQEPSSEINFATVNGSSTDNYIKLNWEKMHRFMEKYNTESIESSIERVRKGDLNLFIYDSPIIAYQVATDPNCLLLTVGAPFGGEGYGIGLPKGSHLNKKMSALIQNYTSGTIMEELIDKWFRGASSKGCSKPAKNTQTPLGLAHAMGLFYFFSCGVSFSIICLLFEIIAYKWLVPHIRKKPANSRWKDLLIYSQRLHKCVNNQEFTQPKPKAVLMDMVNILKSGQKQQKPLNNEMYDKSGSASTPENSNRYSQIYDDEYPYERKGQILKLVPNSLPPSYNPYPSSYNIPSKHQDSPQGHHPSTYDFSPGHINCLPSLPDTSYKVSEKISPPMSNDSCQDSSNQDSDTSKHMQGMLGTTPRSKPQSILKKKDPRKQLQEIEKEFSQKFDEALKEGTLLHNKLKNSSKK